MEQLEGRVAVVTGAASGIGRAIVDALVAERMRVVMADVEEAALVRAAGEVTGAGGDVLAVVCDVSNAASVVALRDETLAAYGAVHLVCNNAGVAPVGPMVETTASDWAWVLGVNVAGVAHGVITFGPLMAAQGFGHIVNTASEAGLSTVPILGMYCASKHAVVGLSEALYKELGPQGVGVSVLCPNLVRTQIFHSERNRPEAPPATVTQHETLGMLREVIDQVGISPAEVAAAVVAAVKENRFWILTHETAVAVVAARADDIAAGRNPSNVYGDS
jgi:NAD(P)-dependent dehydrogenase (short-subunit alcohol dehydrogenase family)